ncbi:MAG TPA: PEP-CTERM sorting domain-containing protein [Verrucomicrobiae bacterium]|nr:PEP-CTERM sorting domain-containing protein [Verrucomicrobiae bacterium]
MRFGFPRALRLAATFATAFVFLVGVEARAQVIYDNDFESIAGPAWSVTNRSVTPVGGRTFLGDFGNQTVTLTLSSLPSHSELILSFDLFIIRTWDGNNTIAGPDIWDLSVEGGSTLLHTTFQNPHNLWASSGQGYPGTYPGDLYPSGTGAAETNTLGYVDQGPLHLGNMDMVYKLTFTIPHSGSSIALDFSASGLEGVDNESWGLDNLVVAVPEPSSFALCVVGAAALTGGVLRRKSTRSVRS